MQRDSTAQNAIHAAAAWLARIGGGAASVVVVSIAPRAAVGVWRPGAAAVGMLARIDDAGAELCEAAAPAAEKALAQLVPDAHAAALAAVAAGSALQLLLWPAMDQLELRLMRDGQAVCVAAASIPRDLH